MLDGLRAIWKLWPSRSSRRGPLTRKASAMNDAIARSTLEVRIKFVRWSATKRHSFRLAMNHAITGNRTSGHRRAKASNQTWSFKSHLAEDSDSLVIRDAITEISLLTQRLQTESPSSASHSTSIQ